MSTVQSRVRDLREHRQRGLHGGVVAEQRGRVPIAPGERVGLRLVRGRRLEQRGGDRLLQRANLERLDQEVARAGVHGPHRIGDLRAAAHHDDRRSRRMHARGGQDLEAGHLRHPDVRQDQIEALFLQARVGTDAVHRDNFMTRGPENAAQAPAQRLFVVAEEDLAHGVRMRAESVLESGSSFSRSIRFARAFFALKPTFFHLASTSLPPRFHLASTSLPPPLPLCFDSASTSASALLRLRFHLRFRSASTPLPFHLRSKFSSSSLLGFPPKLQRSRSVALACPASTV